MRRLNVFAELETNLNRVGKVEAAGSGKIRFLAPMQAQQPTRIVTKENLCSAQAPCLKN